MHILIATDGRLDVKRATEVVGRLHRPGDAVTVLTAVDHPKRFLHEYAETAGVSEIATVAHEAGAGVIGFASGAKAAERLAPWLNEARSAAQPPRLGKYFAEKATSRVDALVRQLHEAGVTVDAAWTTSDNQTAEVILNAAERLRADLLVVGSHRSNWLENVLGSTASKLLHRASVPVVVVPDPNEDDRPNPAGTEGVR